MQGIEDDKDVEKQINEDEEKTAVEDSMTGIEDDKDVEKQINGQEQTRKDESKDFFSYFNAANKMDGVQSRS